MAAAAKVRIRKEVNMIMVQSSVFQVIDRMVPRISGRFLIDIR